MDHRRGGFRLTPFAIASVLVASAFPAGAALAADTGTSNADLDQRIRILERQLELLKEDAAAKAKEASTPSVGEKGLSVKKGDFEIRFKGLVQADGRVFVDDFNPTNSSITSTTNRDSLYLNDTFTFRRIEPTFEGTFGKLVGFKLTPSFTGNGSGESASILDAYIDLKFDPAYTLRAGKFKEPVSLENLQSSSTLEFVERGFPTELAPSRDLGVQLQGELFKSTVAYALGYFNGTPDGRDVSSTDVDNRKEVAARLFFEPFKNDPGFFQGFGFGVGGSHGNNQQGAFNAANVNGFLPRYRTPGQNQFFAYTAAVAATTGTGGAAGKAGNTGTYADGDHDRISPQLYFYRNSFGLLSEYIVSSQEVSLGFIPAPAAGVTTASQTPTAYASEKVRNSAWQVAASYVLTGEDASYKGVQRIEHPFAIGEPGWGALELTARYGELKIDDDAFDTNTVGGTVVPAFADPTKSAERARAYTVGFNWYLTTNAKVVVNYAETSFIGGGSGTATVPVDRRTEQAVLSRLQLSF